MYACHFIYRQKLTRFHIIVTKKWKIFIDLSQKIFYNILERIDAI